MLQAKLIVVGGEVKTKEVNLRLPAVIGRGREATLTLPHALVSRAHCEVFERDGRLFVRDLDSLNGTYVNSYKIVGDQPLMPGELLTIGTVTFRADYQIAREANLKAPQSIAAKNGTQENTKTESSRNAEWMTNDKPQDKRFETTVAGRPPTIPATAEALTPPSNQVVHASQHALNELSADESNVLNEDVLNEFDLASTPAKSISLSAIDQLPGRINQASFVGSIGDNPTAAVSDVHAFLKIESGGENHGANDDANNDNSRLDSFIKKLPK